MNLENGFYWVCKGKTWTVAYYWKETKQWMSPLFAGEYAEDYWDEIGDIIFSKKDKPYMTMRRENVIAIFIIISIIFIIMLLGYALLYFYLTH